MLLKMNLDEYTILYEEINEKNNFVKDLKKNEHQKLGLVTFTKDDKIEEYLPVKYCMKRNLCRLYNPVIKIFNYEETILVALNTIESFLTADCVVWICSDDIDWLLDLGFKNPYFCSHDPFGESVKLCIAVNKINDPHFETNVRTRHNGADEDYSLYQQRRTSPTREHKLTMFDFSKKHFESNDTIELKIKFEQEDLEYLKKLVYSGRTLNDDGTMTQKEVSGVLYLEYTGKDFELKIDKSKNFNAHDEEKVRFVNGLINFHTHPLEVYNNYDVEMMYPSPTDYSSILSFLMQKYCFENHKYVLCPLLFSCVVAVEGIYIVSLNKNYCIKDKRDNLRETICSDKETHYEIKQGIKDSINSKSNGISGFLYGKDKNTQNYYDTHCKYIGDPKDHPLGYCQVGGFDYDTTKHNRKENQMYQFPETFEKDGYVYDRLAQAGKDYCKKINRRQLVTGTHFTDGPVLNVQFYTYKELENQTFSIYTCNVSTPTLPLQTILNEETIQDIKLFNQI